MERKYYRGEMYFAQLGNGIGSEQKGRRPVVIIQNDIGNTYSPTLIVAAITSEIYGKPQLPTHCFLKADNGLQKDSYVLLEQIRTIDKSRIGKYIGRIPEVHISKLNRGLEISVGLNKKKKTSLWLCDTCAKKIRNAGVFSLLKYQGFVKKKEVCCLCKKKPGLMYSLIIKEKEFCNG